MTDLLPLLPRGNGTITEAGCSGTDRTPSTFGPQHVSSTMTETTGGKGGVYTKRVSRYSTATSAAAVCAAPN